MRTVTAEADTGQAPAAEPHEVERTRWGVVIVLALGTLAIASEMTLAAFALPLIGADLGVSAAATAWVLLAYSLPLAALAIPAGRWVDGADLRTVVAVAMVGLGLTGVMGAYAPNFEVLIVARVLHGISAAIFLATMMPILTRNTRPDQSGRAMSFQMTVMTLGSIVATPLGGFVAGAFGWREVFLIKIPLVVVVLVVGYWAFASGNHQGRRLPTPSRTLLLDVVLVGAAVTALLLALDQAEGRAVLAVALLAAAGVLGVSWVRLPGTRPVLALVRRPATGFALLALMTLAASIGLISFLLPFFISDVLRQSPNVLGIAMLFLVVAMSATAPVTGFLVDRFGPAPITAVGAAASVAALTLFLTLGAEAALVDLAWRMVLFGVGFGLFNPAVMTAILADSPKGQSGASGGLANTARTLGTMIGPAVAALGWSLGGGGLQGFHVGNIAVTALAAIAILAALAAYRSSRTSAAQGI